MTGYQKVFCVLLALGFLLTFGGFCAFEARLPIIGTILVGSGLLSFLSIHLVVWRKEWERLKKEKSREYR